MFENSNALATRAALGGDCCGDETSRMASSSLVIRDLELLSSTSESPGAPHLVFGISPLLLLREVQYSGSTSKLRWGDVS